MAYDSDNSAYGLAVHFCNEGLHISESQIAVLFRVEEIPDVSIHVRNVAFVAFV